MSSIKTILSGEAGATGVQQVTTPATIRPMVEQMLCDTAKVTKIELQRAKFKPGRKLTAYYSVQIADSAADGSSHNVAAATDTTAHPIAITWAMPGAPQSLAETEGALGAAIRERALASSFAKLVWSDTKESVHIQIAPFDPVFPQLAALSDPSHVHSLLSDAVDLSAQWTITPIRYRPRQRHVLRYTTTGDRQQGQPQSNFGTLQSASSQALYAKVYADDSHCDFLTLNTELAEWLAPSNHNVDVLRPLCYLPTETTMLYAEVQGTPLSAQLDGSRTMNKSRLHRYLYQAGAALRHLHDTPRALFHTLPKLTVTAEVKAIRRTCEQIQVLLPATWQIIDVLLARTLDAYEATPQEEPTFVHGDFKADHLLAAGSHLTLIDCDSCALADPSYDIGKFLADLGWFYGGWQSPAFDAATQAFFDGYGLALTDPRLQRARLWQRFIGIKIVAHRLRIFEQDWAVRTAAILQRYAATV